MKDKNVTKNAVAIAIISLVACFVAGYVIVDHNGHNPSNLIQFAMFVIPVLVVQLYLGNVNSQQNSEIKSSVNGKLTAQFNDLKEHVSSELAKTKEAKETDSV